MDFNGIVVVLQVDYVTDLIEKAGVAVVPGRGFFHQQPSFGNQHTTRYVRIAFCKDMTTLKAANTAIRKHLASQEPGACTIDAAS